MSEGCLEILSVGAGHTKVSFDKDDPADTKRAKRMIEDMLARGYTILVEDEKGKLRRVESFDKKTDSYVVRMPRGRMKGEGKSKKTKLLIAKTKATGVAPTAGG